MISDWYFNIPATSVGGIMSAGSIIVINEDVCEKQY